MHSVYEGHALGFTWAFISAPLQTCAAQLRLLRHTHATHVLANGVHPKIASERLDHSKVGITLDLHSHVIPGIQQDAADMVSNPVAGRIGGTEQE